MAATLWVLCVLGPWFVQACSSGAQTDAFATLSSAYDPTLVWHASHENGLHTVIVGSPFSSATEHDGKRLRAMLNLPPWHQQGDFTIVASTAPLRGYRLVLIFDPASPLPFGAACGNLDRIETTKHSERVRLHAAFCSRDRALSEIDGHGSDLQAVLDQTIAGLLPPDNRDNFDEGRCAGVFRLCL